MPIKFLCIPIAFSSLVNDTFLKPFQEVESRSAIDKNLTVVTFILLHAKSQELLSNRMTIIQIKILCFPLYLVLYLLYTHTHIDNYNNAAKHFVHGEMSIQLQNPQLAYTLFQIVTKLFNASNHEAYAHCLLYASLMWGRKHGGDLYGA